MTTAPDPAIRDLEYVTHRLLREVRKALYGTEPEPERMKNAWIALHDFEQESGLRRLEDFFRKGWMWRVNIHAAWYQKVILGLWRLVMPRPRW
jgi:hypothetical protein